MIPDAADRERMATLRVRVRVAMSRTDIRMQTCSPWWTLHELANATGGSEAGVSARLRELRRTSASTGRVYDKRHECPDPYDVERRKAGSGLYEYRLLLPPDDGPTQEELAF